MTKQERILKNLNARDKETLRYLLRHFGSHLVNFSIEKGHDQERAVELVLDLFLQWILDGFATPSWPLDEWMELQVHRECERVLAECN